MLTALRLVPFSHGEITPTGWLKRQLRIQADGLCGHLDTVWPDIQDSRWIGGQAEGWERVPYWLDGFIPLAYLLDDEDMKRRAGRYVDSILARQAEDGWICPCAPQERATYDIWASLLIGKVLAMYADLSGDLRVEPALERLFAQMEDHLDHHTLHRWGAARWFEGLITLFWLYERTGEEWLLRVARKLEILGFDYEKLLCDYQDQEPQRKWTFLTHVVNLAMCIKQGALKSRLNRADPNAFAYAALQNLLRSHSMAVGHFSGDECVAGDAPNRGTELCGVVEAMYSYEQLLSIGGDPHWGDVLERLAFNALPATISTDMWTHQYDQMTNQVRCQALPSDHVVFGTNGPESHLFGLEPNYGCCTANFGQGWPKLAMSAFMCGQDELASVVLVPSQVRCKIGGVPVTCSLETEYPFKGDMRYIVECASEAEFSLSIRIPAFASYATVNGEPVQVGAFHKVRRVWQGTEEVRVELTFDFDFVPRPRDMACLWRGPLLYSVAIEEKWEKREYVTNGVERKFPFCDYEVLPMSPWNYAFYGKNPCLKENEVAAAPFDTAAPAVEVYVDMAPIDWPEEYGICATEPRGREPLGPPQPVRMIPYGCAKLRMTEMPVVGE
ncbi:MAG: glycoside hydrolase family 127 protein [Clostridia bacterium]|nr:glycoside hydrolase family 127 protein [Clostridia bacterium]